MHRLDDLILFELRAHFPAFLHFVIFRPETVNYRPIEHRYGDGPAWCVSLIVDTTDDVEQFSALFTFIFHICSPSFPRCRIPHLAPRWRTAAWKLSVDQPLAGTLGLLTRIYIYLHITHDRIPSRCAVGASLVLSFVLQSGWHSPPPYRRKREQERRASRARRKEQGMIS